MCLGMDGFDFTLVGICGASFMLIFMSFIRFWGLPALIFKYCLLIPLEWAGSSLLPLKWCCEELSLCHCLLVYLLFQEWEVQFPICQTHLLNWCEIFEFVCFIYKNPYMNLSLLSLRIMCHSVFLLS